MAGITKDTIFNLIPGDTTVSELVEQGNPPVDPKSAVEEGSPADAKKTLDLINEKVTRSEAHYLTSDSEGNPFPTKAALDAATEFFYAGNPHEPCKNDYCNVLKDETRIERGIAPLTRYAFILDDEDAVADEGEADEGEADEGEADEGEAGEGEVSGQWQYQFTISLPSERTGEIPYKYLAKIDERIYEAEYGILNKDVAYGLLEKEWMPAAACSAMRASGFFGRNYDWLYRDSVTFVVKTPSDGSRLSSVSVCSGPQGVDRISVESCSISYEKACTIPFMALDGINEKGVFCCINVVPYNEEKAAFWTGTEVCGLAAVRLVLDNASTAAEGAAMIKDKVWMPDHQKIGGYSFHYLVGDAFETYIVEDGAVVKLGLQDKPVMTNFRCATVGGYIGSDGHVDVDALAAVDPYGSGTERYDILLDRHTSANTLPGMRGAMEAVRFSKAYEDPDAPSRPSEFAGGFVKDDGSPVKVNETDVIEAWYAENDIHNKWLQRKRDGESKFWETVHTSVYDVSERKVFVKVNETDKEYAFGVPLNRSGRSDIGYLTMANLGHGVWNLSDTLVDANDGNVKFGRR